MNVKFTLLACAILILNLGKAQTIDFDLASPMPDFQDADNGAMAFADVDDDGDQDFLVLGNAPGSPIKTTLYLNDGTGGFTEVLDTPFENLLSGLIGFADVDNDGDKDVVITGSTSSPQYTANLYLNDGTGGFTLQAGTPFEPCSVGDLAFGDYDSDGDLDVFLTGYDASNDGFSHLYANDGSGQFTIVTGTPFVQVTNGAMEFLDMDNDNAPDIILTGEDATGQAVTALYHNNGSGSYTEVPKGDLDDINSGDVAVGDVDLDGDQDVILSGMNGASEVVTKLYLNDGTGAFSLVSGTPFDNTFLGVTRFADFDLDGDEDVIVVGSGLGGLANNSIVANIYENLGNQQFIRADSLIGTYVSSIAIADVDGDLAPDLVIGGTSTGVPVRATRLYTNLTPIVTGVSEVSESFSSRLFPNPNQGAFTIEWDATVQAKVEVYDLSGKLLHAETLRSQSQSLDLSLPSGVYVVSIKSSKVSEVHKVLVH